MEILIVLKLFSFLQAETKGYQVVTLGSSAGGFAAVLYG
jgi:predicted rRNA methylase YqxC with S4 and FtsJ domains